MIDPIKYRAIIVFTDGTFTVDVTAVRPDTALSMALIDARSLHANTTYSGKAVSFTLIPFSELCVLRAPAHCMEDDTPERYLRDYGVTTREIDPPYDYEFVGRREQLERMYRECWTDDPEDIKATFESIMEYRP